MQQFFTKTGKKVQFWKFLNKDRLTIGSWVNDKNITYDPRNRPWYKIAINTDVIRKTNPYIYAMEIVSDSETNQEEYNPQKEF